MDRRFAEPDIQPVVFRDQPASPPFHPTLPGSSPARPGGSAAGHRHLYCLLPVHELLRDCGVTQAFGQLTGVQIAAALDARAYFGLHDLAATVAEIPLAASSPLSARVFDVEYRRRFTLTDRVVTAIRERVAIGPNDFPLA